MWSTALLNSTDPTEFDAIANWLLNESSLVVAERDAHPRTTYQPIEIEFYLKTPDHPDPYIHGAAEQVTVGEWYLHRSGAQARGSYRSGTFKGLDLTFGAGAHGGILLRSVIESCPQRPDVVVEGPCKTVEAIMRAAGVDTVAALADRIGDGSVVNPYAELRLDPAPARRLPIYTSARVGLNASKDDPYIGFAAAPYRYISRPDLVKKDRKSIRAGMLAMGMSTEEADAALGVQRRAGVKK